MQRLRFLENRCIELENAIKTPLAQAVEPLLEQSLNNLTRKDPIGMGALTVVNNPVLKQAGHQHEEKEEGFLKNWYGKRKWQDAYVYAASSGAIGSVSVLLAGCASKTLVVRVLASFCSYVDSVV